MWTDQGLNLDISGEGLVTERLILGMTSDLQRSFPFNHCRSQTNVLAFLPIQLVPHQTLACRPASHTQCFDRQTTLHANAGELSQIT
jgi:hypothetical protein